METAPQTNSPSYHRKKSAPLKLRTQGWITTDDDEILRRRLRGQQDGFRVRPLGSTQTIFSEYTVRAGDGAGYVVELRSITDPINSCTCPDHAINCLGTCKHIEATLHWLGRKHGARMKRAAREGHAKIEIFIDRRDDQIKVAWPRGSQGHAAPMRRRLKALFDDQGVLMGDPLTALPALERCMAAAAAAQKTQVRMSAHVGTWYAELDRRAAGIRARQVFEAEVASGKRNLNVVKLPLYPYQQEGMLHLAFGGRALLADEMGLGKTAQAIAACELLRQVRGIRRVLVISPASLKAEWEEQIVKFTDQPSRIIIGSRAARLQHYGAPSFFYLANYEQILHDVDEINTRLAPDVIILDEAQRIKNWQSKIANAVKRLSSPFAFVLTGTPVENRIDEIYSIMQFLDGRVLGPLFRFNRDFYKLDENGRPAGYKNLDVLHQRLRPYMLRRRKQDIEEQLPSRTDKTYFVTLDKEQAAYYEDYASRVARLAAMARRRPLTKQEMEKLQRGLACMRMVCDTPYIIDRTCQVCPKLDELRIILGEILAEGEHKIIIFSEWERMLVLVRGVIEKMKLDYAWHTGSTPQTKRRADIRRFKDDPRCRFFLSTDSGSVGLNLQAADIVINLDLPWNPARLEQRIARAWRKHQQRPVRVINLVSENTIEHRMVPLLAQKRNLAQGVVDGAAEYSEMTMPSGRAAFLERVEALMAVSPAVEPSQLPGPVSSDSAQRLREETRPLCDQRLDLLELHRTDVHPTVLAVADQVDEPLRASLKRAIAVSYGESGPNLEVIDRATFETIQRLMQSGILRPGTHASEALYQSASIQQGAAADRRRAALEQLSRADRPRKMAMLLIEGGFVVEACKPMRDAVEAATKALAALAGEHDTEIVPLRVVTSHLIGRGWLPADAVASIARLREIEAGIDETHARTLIEQSTKLLESAAKAVQDVAPP